MNNDIRIEHNKNNWSRLFTKEALVEHIASPATKLIQQEWKEGLVKDPATQQQRVGLLTS